MGRLVNRADGWLVIQITLVIRFKNTSKINRCVHGELNGYHATSMGRGSHYATWCRVIYYRKIKL